MISFVKTTKTRWTWYQWLRAVGQLCYAGLVIAAILGKSFGVAIGLMVLALLGGAFFCGWFCPLGTVQEWLGRLGSRIMGGRRLKISERVEKRLVPLRYILMVASFSGLAFLMFLGFLSQPYQTFMGLIAGNTAYVTVAAWSLLGLFLVSSLLIDRPFCRYFCTEGARYGILSMARLFSIRRRASKCINCGACDKKCPTQVKISTKSHVRNPQCVNCMECISTCPVDGALSYGCVINWKKKEEVNDETN